jgi:hypothetical protein
MTLARRRIGPWGTLFALVLGAAASCRGYERCSERRGGCRPEGGDAGRGASGASGGEPGESGAAGERAPTGGTTAGSGAFGGAGQNSGGAGSAGATAGSVGRGGSAGKDLVNDGGAGDGPGGARGAVAGDGGEAGIAPLVCEETRGDCDGSTLNGCETNLLESVYHCGGCERECAGLCDGGECLEFERMVPDQFFPETIALAPDYAYLAAHDAFDFPHMLRVSRWIAQVDTVLADAPSLRIRASTVSSERVYVSDEYSLKSFALDGTDLRDEGLIVESVAAYGGFLYYANLGSLYRWSEVDRTPELVREFSATGSIELASTVPGVFVAVSYPAGIEGARYELYFLHPTLEPRLIGGGSGSATGLVAVETDAYFIVRNDAGIELRHVPGTDQSFVLESDASKIVDLAAVAGGVFATFDATTQWGLRFYAFYAQPIRFEWQTRGKLLCPTSTARGELWFVDSSQAALVRVKERASFP